MVLPFWYRLTQVVTVKGLLNEVCVYDFSILKVQYVHLSLNQTRKHISKTLFIYITIRWWHGYSQHQQLETVKQFYLSVYSNSC